ncbi:MAG: hypothetical protein ACOYUZ_05705 [Patescibacteria group bacterium]
MSAFTALDKTVSRIQNFLNYRESPEWIIINDPEELSDVKKLPRDLHYILSIHPSRFSQLQTVLTRNCGLAISYDKNIPDNIVRSVNRIANTQEGTLFPWLEDFFKDDVNPPWSEDDLADASARDIDLHEELFALKKFYQNCQQISFIYPPGAAPHKDDEHLTRTLLKDLKNLRAAEMAHLIAAKKHSYTSWHLALALLGIIFLIPIIYVMTLLYEPLGLLSAVLLPGLAVEGNYYYNSYKYGAASWQLKRKIRQILPWTSLQIIFAVIAYLFKNSDYNILAGICLGVAVTIFPVKSYVFNSLRALSGWQNLNYQGKAVYIHRWPWLKAKEGRFWWLRPASIITAFALCLAVYARMSDGNAWILALLGLSPHLLAQVLNILRRQFVSWQLKNDMRRELKYGIIVE